jgi:phosphate starvation-inducible PhoH-like protein
MTEKLILLEGIDPMALYGVNNLNYNLLVGAFPKLKIVARGQEIKVAGEPMEIERFEDKLMLVVDFYSHYNRLNQEDMKALISDEAKAMEESGEDVSDVLVWGNSGKAIRARTINQRKMVEQYAKNDLLFALGPAGSGKTYTAIALAVRALKNKEVRRIVLTRPAVEAGERLGFLPGDMKEKLDPYLQPLYDALHDMLPARKLASYMEDGTVQIAPLAFMRGRTLDNAFVILDEAQNTTIPQIKMFLTRMGKNAKFIITGDVTQIDLPRKQDSGLIKAAHLLKRIDGIGFVELDSRDILRHRIVKYIVQAFDKDQELASGQTNT